MEENKNMIAAENAAGTELNNADSECENQILLVPRDALVLAERGLSEYASELTGKNLKNKSLLSDVSYAITVVGNYLYQISKNTDEAIVEKNENSTVRNILICAKNIVNNDVKSVVDISNEFPVEKAWVRDVCETMFRLSHKPTIKDVIGFNQKEYHEFLEKPIPLDVTGKPDLFQLANDAVAVFGLQDDHYHEYVHDQLCRMSVRELADVCVQYGRYFEAHKNDVRTLTVPDNLRYTWDMYGTHFKSVQDEIFHFIFYEAARILEYRTRESKNGFEKLLYGMFLNRIPVPKWLHDHMERRSADFSETDAEIAWAWTYAVQNVPEDHKKLFTKNSGEKETAYYLCQILPSLKKYYTDKYSVFRIPHNLESLFSDQTETYRKFRVDVVLPGDFNIKGVTLS